MTLEFSLLNFEKYSNIKFHENPSSENLFVPCGWTDGEQPDRHAMYMATFAVFAKPYVLIPPLNMTDC